MGSSGEVGAIQNMADFLNRLQRPLDEQGVKEVNGFINSLIQPEQVGNCLLFLLHHSTNITVIDCALARLAEIHKPHRHDAWVTALDHVAELLWKEGRYLETKDGEPGWLPRLYTIAFSQPCQDQRSHENLLALHRRYGPPASYADFGIRIVSGRVMVGMKLAEERLS